jgi:hypothetical protein
MYSNFITPPDLVENILVIDATREHVDHCAEFCRETNVLFNIYFYISNSDNTVWLNKVINRVDVILIPTDCEIKINSKRAVVYTFGENGKFKEPVEFLNK